MKKEKRWIIPVVIIIIILLCVAGYAAYYFYAFTQLKITDVNVNSMDDFSLKGFTFSGYIDLYNPSWISVKVTQIDYEIVFEPTAQLLSAGSLEGTSLPAGKVTRVPFQKTINWAPALSLVLQLATSKEPANIVFAGQVQVTEKVKLPFVYKVDLRTYFEAYAKEYIESKKETALDTIEEKYGKTVGAIAEHIASYLPI
ncbi:LEA type 2 family protein [Candidatus Woesearchaeota archaeon]|nr:LEA type 2 family protein [Candidatus Woesearchaeota archaeon]